MNIRSLYGKLDELNSFLSKYRYKFEFVCVTETWLTPSTVPLASIPHFDFFFCVNREDGRRRSGVGVYVRKGIQCENIQHLSGVSN